MDKQPSFSKPVYFPHLDGLRFIGSLIIIIFHIEGIKSRHQIPAFEFIEGYHFSGEYDVSLFFVLSGFLITYLLLREKKEYGSINLKAYYTRRTLRIWPLYYAILILGFFILPLLGIGSASNNAFSIHFHRHFWVYFIACFFFLSPLAKSAHGLPVGIGPIWSVGVEELFYLCWPLFLRKTRKYLILFFGVILIVVFLRNGLILGNILFNIRQSFTVQFVFVRDLLMQYRISCMAIGGIGAYLLVFEKTRILNVLFRRDIQWVVYLLTLGLLLLRVGVNYYFGIYHEFYSFLFAIMIVNLAANPKSIIRLNFKWMTYLGKVSYGLYMYHYMMALLSIRLIDYLFKKELSGWQMNLCLYFFTLSFTIIIAILSYEFFEKKFLNMKKKFTA